jgi:hypothetical protein
LDPDEERLAHADGMGMFIDNDTLIMNNYEDFWGPDDTNPNYSKNLESTLRSAFPNTNIYELYSGSNVGKWPGFSSSCGVYVNSVTT